MVTAGWFKSLLEQRGVKYQEFRERVAFRVGEVALRRPVGVELRAKIVVVLADGRTAVLILSSSRRVVLDCVGKLLGADLVRLVSESEIEGSLARRRSTEAGMAPEHEPIIMLMDASLLCAGHLMLQAGRFDDTIRLTFEDWLSLANPGVGFFTEPNHDSPQALT